MWRLPIPATVRRLATVLAKPEPDGIDRYERCITSVRARHVALWKKAQEYFPSGGAECRAVRRRLGLPYDLAHQTWLKRGGQWVGGAGRLDIDHALFGNLSEGARLNANIFRTNLRDQAPWKEALLMPLFDMPGRIAAFVFMAQKGQSDPLNVSYQHILPLGDTQRNGKEPGGVCMPESLDLPPGKMGNRVLVCLDPVSALRIQVRHLSNNSVPVPVAGIWGAAATPKMLVEARKSREVVLWSQSWSVDLFRHAVALDARVFVFQSREELREVLSCRNQKLPDYRVRQWLDESVRWEEALGARMAVLPGGEAEDLLQQLKLKPAQAESLLAACPEPVRPLVATILQGTFRTRKILYDRYTVQQDQDGWKATDVLRARGHAFPVTDAPFRIEQIVYQPRDRTTHYIGHVLWRGEEIPFAAEKEVFAKSPMLWLHKMLIRTGRGVTSWNIRWAAESLDVALAFHPPELLRGADIYGWDPARRAFVFPAFVLESDGKVAPGLDVQARKSCTLVGGGLPGEHLRPPEAFGYLDMTAMDDCPVSWPTTLMVLHGLLSHARNEQPWTTALRTDSPEPIRQAIEALGCRHGLNRDNWPGFSGRIDQKPHRVRQAIDENRPGFILPTSLETFLSLGTRPGWLLFQPGRQEAIPAMTLEALAKVLPAFLQRITASGAAWDVSRTLWDILVREVQAWRASLGLAELDQAVLAAVEPPSRDRAVRRFGEVVSRFLEDGDLQAVASAFPAVKKPMAWKPRVVRMDGKAWLPQAAINRCLAARLGLDLDIPVVTASLRETGTLLDEADHCGARGWVVKEDWLDSQLRDYRARNKLLARKQA